MRLQLLSDLHLETEDFRPEPLPGAELLVLAGDIDATWAAYSRFAGWPVPVIVVPGNHEFDGRDVDKALPAFRARIEALGFTLLHRQSVVLKVADGRRVRFVGAPRWSDFDLFGAKERERAMRAARYFMRLMGATRAGRPFDAAAVREEGLVCRSWLEAELARVPPRRAAATQAGGDDAGWDATVVITHFAPSLRSADPRYGAQPGTASFCNADDDLLPRADLWLHGHLHCAHDYQAGRCRVLANPLGYADKGEQAGFVPTLTAEVLGAS